MQEDEVQEAESQVALDYSHWNTPKGGAYWFSSENGEMYQIMRDLEPTLAVGKRPAKEVDIPSERYLHLSANNPEIPSNEFSRLTTKLCKVVEEGGDLVLGGVEYLTTQHGVDQVSKLLKQLDARAKISTSTILIPVDPSCYESSAWKVLMQGIPEVPKPTKAAEALYTTSE